MNDSSLEAIPDKAYALGLEIKRESLTRNNETFWNRSYILLVCANGIICKQLTGYNRENKTVLCHNLNTSPEFQDFGLPLDDGLQIFKILKK